MVKARHSGTVSPARRAQQSRTSRVAQLKVPAALRSAVNSGGFSPCSSILVLKSLGAGLVHIENRPQTSCRDESVEPRDLLDLTVAFDHDVVDGAPAARFVQRLVDLIESGYGLKEVRQEALAPASPN
jgi:pyruvate/2-oxoglutarate dehydrogenase complex dihydrolipoamide acyltransferase (E2) component